MTTLDIYCAGAAKAVVSRAVLAYQEETGCEVSETYGAVGFLKQRMMDGGRPDLIILTAALIDDLIEQHLVRPGSRVDLGDVGTGVAVPAGTAVPAIATEADLRAVMLRASRIVCPDPAVATAGQVLLDALRQLGIADAVSARLEHTASGYAAMARLAERSAPGEVGVMQITEIVAYDAVVLAGPLPSHLQRMTTYSAGLAVDTVRAAQATAFLDRLAGPGSREMLNKAGFASQ